jgi:K+-sensing histidine kinase KdpD
MKSEKNISFEDGRKLNQILQDVYQLSELTQSLLLLAKLEEQNDKSSFEEIRIDEVVFDAFQQVEINYPFLKLNFNVSESIIPEASFTVKGIKSLLEIVFVNLFKNAAIYSKQPNIEVLLHETFYTVYVHVDSFGETISSADQLTMFQSFSRGENSQNIPGSGLGLRIVKRILEFHNATIDYNIPIEYTNRFTIAFKKQIAINL